MVCMVRHTSAMRTLVLLVAEPNRFLLGVHVGTRTPHVNDPVVLCDRIRAER